jgi:ribosomal protein S18 acetylase RimI-like enzyme
VPDTIAFRLINPGDEAFLRAIYASTRAEELAVLDWSDQQKEAFLRMQFDAQHRHYQSHFPQAEFLIILENGEPVGRLYLARNPDAFRIIDIALLPQHRGKGIGGTLLKNILHEAAQSGTPVRIHVERNNRALRLYQRLGFEIIEEGPVYLRMEKRPKDVASGNSPD